MVPFHGVIFFSSQTQIVSATWTARATHVARNSWSGSRIAIHASENYLSLRTYAGYAQLASRLLEQPEVVGDEYDATRKVLNGEG